MILCCLLPLTFLRLSQEIPIVDKSQASAPTTGGNVRYRKAMRSDRRMHYPGVNEG